MKTTAAFLLGLSILAAQALHGGLLVPGLAWPAYMILVTASFCAIFVGARSCSPPAPGALLVAAITAGILVARALLEPESTLARQDAICITAGGLALFTSASLPDARTRLIFLAVLAVGLLGQSVLGAKQLVSQGEFSAIHWFSSALQGFYEGKFTTRARGTFVNPNQLAWFAGTMALFSLALTVWGRLGWGGRLLCGFFALTCVGLEVMTASRAGLASLTLGAGALLLFSIPAAILFRRGGGGAVLVGLAAALVVAAAVTVWAISSSWTAQGRMETFALDQDVRSQLFNEGVRAFQAKPIYGHGPGSFIYLARAYREGRHQENDPIFAHNDWLQIFVEYGFVGGAAVVVALTIFIGGGILRLARIFSDTQRNREGATSTTAAILLGALAAAVAMIAHSGFDFNLRVPANALLAGATLGFLTNPDGCVFRCRGRRILARTLCVSVLALFAASLTWAALRFAKADWLEIESDKALDGRAWAKAIDVAKRGLKEDGDNPRILQVLARTQFARAMGGVMRDESGRVQIRTIDGNVGNRLGLDEDTIRNLETAGESYGRLVQLAPRERAVLTEYGRVLVRVGRRKNAEAITVEAVALDPLHGYVYSALGDLFLDAGDLDRAARAYYVGARQPGGLLCQAKFEAVRELIAKEPFDAREGNSQ